MAHTSQMLSCHGRFWGERKSPYQMLHCPWRFWGEKRAFTQAKHYTVITRMTALRWMLVLPLVLFLRLWRAKSLDGVHKLQL